MRGFGAALLVLTGSLLPFALSDTPGEWNDSVTGMSFILIQPGDFVMGSPVSEPGREAQEIAHVVHITRPFYMGRYEVDQAQWEKVMGKNPSRFPDCGRDCPVESVNWYQVNEFIERLNKLSSREFRLPTEAEWEYACRAGTNTPFNTGGNLTAEQSNYDGRYPYHNNPAGKYRARPTPVGSFPPNAWGLHDMHGNVWEWTADAYCPYGQTPVSDPHPDCKTPYRVIRGGSWYFGADSARCALRYTHRPGDSGFSLGFRLACSVSPK